MMVFPTVDNLLGNLIDFLFAGLELTPHITGSKEKSEERATLLAVRVHVIVRLAE